MPFQILIEKQVPSRLSTIPTSENSTCTHGSTDSNCLAFCLVCIQHNQALHKQNHFVDVLMSMKHDHCLLQALARYTCTPSIHRSILIGQDFFKAKSILNWNSKSRQNLKPISDFVKSKVRGPPDCPIWGHAYKASHHVLTLKLKGYYSLPLQNLDESQVKVNSIKATVCKRPSFTRTKAISPTQKYSKRHYALLQLRVDSWLNIQEKHQNQQGLDQSGHRMSDTASFKRCTGQDLVLSLPLPQHSKATWQFLKWGSRLFGLSLPEKDRKALAYTYWGLKLQAFFLKVRVYLMKKNH